MTDEPVPNRVKELWQGQATQGGTISLDEIQIRSRRLARIIGRRNLREYIAAVVALIAFGYIAWRAPSLITQAGAWLAMAATVFIVYHLHRQGTARPMPADLALTDCLQFHRRELERQRDLLRSVWTWYLLPMVPGVIVILIGGAVVHPDRLIRIGVAATVVLGVFMAIGELNRRVANRIQAKIDALEGEI